MEKLTPTLEDITEVSKRLGNKPIYDEITFAEFESELRKYLQEKHITEGCMNKQELLDKAVHEFGGKWGSPKKRLVHCDDLGFIYSDERMMHTHSWFISEFQQRARELGYINGYRWGVEYPTGGKKPDLDGGVVVKVAGKFINGGWYSYNYAVADTDWLDAISFKITDRRYKPSDTSYLETPALEPVPEERHWYDYTAKKAVALPPVGTECIVLDEVQAKIIGKTASGYLVYESVVTGLCEMACQITSFKPLDHNHKAEAEKKRVVDAAWDSLTEFSTAKQVLGDLYDAGYLKLPTE